MLLGGNDMAGPYLCQSRLGQSLPQHAPHLTKLYTAGVGSLLSRDRKRAASYRFTRASHSSLP